MHVRRVVAAAGLPFSEVYSRLALPARRVVAVRSRRGNCSTIGDLDGLRQPTDIIGIHPSYSEEEYGEDDLYTDGEFSCVVTLEEAPRLGCTLAVAHKGLARGHDLYASEDGERGAQREFLIDFVSAYANADPSLRGGQ